VPNIDRCGFVGSELSVSEPAALDTLTMRAAGASRRSGSIACVTAVTPNTFRPALLTLLEAAAAAGEVRAGVEPKDLLQAVASLCAPAHDRGPEHARRMVALLLDGLRYGASRSVNTPGPRRQRAS
jgi:hypothetical protein